MKILLDECLPRRLRQELPNHDVTTVAAMGWAGTKNGALLRLAADAGFDMFITIDGNMEYMVDPFVKTLDWVFLTRGIRSASQSKTGRRSPARLL